MDQIPSMNVLEVQCITSSDPIPKVWLLKNKGANMIYETSGGIMSDSVPDGKFIVYHSEKTGEYHVKIWNAKRGRYLISKTFSPDQKEAAEEYFRKRQSEK